MTTFKCDLKHDKLNAPCSSDEPNTLDVHIVLEENINELRIHYQSIVHLDNGTDLGLSADSIDFCSFANTPIMYPVFGEIFRRMQLAGKVPQTCAMTKASNMDTFAKYMCIIRVLLYISGNSNCFEQFSPRHRPNAAIHARG